MSRIHAKATDVLVDEFNFDSVIHTVTIDINRPMSDVTAYADTDAVYLAGKPGFTISVDGLWSTASPDYDGEMFTDLTSEARRVGIYPNQLTAGEFGYEGDCNISASPRVASFSDAIALNVTWQGDTPIIRSQSLYLNTAFGGPTANGTAYQHGAVSATQKVVGILRMFTAPAGAGNNTLNVTVQSDNVENFGGTPETQLTFTQLTQASVALHEVQAANGAITDTWWRVVLTFAGVGTRTFDILVVIGICEQ